MFNLRPHEVVLVIPGGTTEDEAGTIIHQPPTESEPIPAHVDTLSGRRLEIAQRINVSTTGIIYIDYQELPTFNTIKHGDDTYSLTAPPINQGGLSEQLALYVREVE